jgi:hypothetical protein
MLGSLFTSIVRALPFIAFQWAADNIFQPFILQTHKQIGKILRIGFVVLLDCSAQILATDDRLNGFIWSDIILQTADSTVFSG